ncbi:MAG: phage tail tube protein [Methanomassiliicoccaceae archaeon]|nr:phage tail tube protein [Methanomassiliicoccaceae archaeon]
MAIKTAGSLGSLIYAEERDYGVTPNGGWRFIGNMRTLDTTDDPGAETVLSDGRIYSDVLFTARDCKFTAELSVFRDAGGYAWDQLLRLALGSHGGSADDLPSFSAISKIASDQFFIARGCKADSLKLYADGVGKQVYATMDAICQNISEQTATLSELGVSSPPAAPSSPPLTYSAYPSSSIPGLAVIPSASVELTVSNNMTPKEGFVGGRALVAGSGIVPGIADIELALKVMSVSSFYDSLKRNGTKGFEVSLRLNNSILTMKNCHLPGDDQPSRSHDAYDEPVKIKAADIAVTRVVA